MTNRRRSKSHLARVKAAWRYIASRQYLPDNAAEIIAGDMYPTELLVAAGKAIKDAESAPFRENLPWLPALRDALALYEDKP